MKGKFIGRILQVCQKIKSKIWTRSACPWEGREDSFWGLRRQEFVSLRASLGLFQRLNMAQRLKV